jgi:hypothetical protein
MPLNFTEAQEKWNAILPVVDKPEKSTEAETAAPVPYDEYIEQRDEFYNYFLENSANVKVLEGVKNPQPEDIKTINSIRSAYCLQHLIAKYRDDNNISEQALFAALPDKYLLQSDVTLQSIKELSEKLETLGVGAEDAQISLDNYFSRVRNTLLSHDVAKSPKFVALYEKLVADDSIKVADGVLVEHDEMAKLVHAFFNKTPHALETYKDGHPDAIAAIKETRALFGDDIAEFIELAQTGFNGPQQIQGEALSQQLAGLMTKLVNNPNQAQKYMAIAQMEALCDILGVVGFVKDKSLPVSSAILKYNAKFMEIMATVAQDENVGADLDGDKKIKAKCVEAYKQYGEYRAGNVGLQDDNGYKALKDTLLKKTKAGEQHIDAAFQRLVCCARMPESGITVDHLVKSFNELIPNEQKILLFEMSQTGFEKTSVMLGYLPDTLVNYYKKDEKNGLKNALKTAVTGFFTQRSSEDDKMRIGESTEHSFSEIRNYTADESKSYTKDNIDSLGARAVFCNEAMSKETREQGVQHTKLHQGSIQAIRQKLSGAGLNF